MPPLSLEDTGVYWRGVLKPGCVLQIASRRDRMVRPGQLELAMRANGRTRAEVCKVLVAVDRIIYSRTLEAVSSARTRIERNFDPESIRRLKARAERDTTIGGPDLAVQAIKDGLVDEFHLFLAPIVVGGTQALPSQVRLTLELLDERRFGSSVVHLHYRSRT